MWRWLAAIAGSVLYLMLALPPAALATTASISLSKIEGPPTSGTRVIGQGFGSTETVDLSFDSTPLGTASTDASGAFEQKVSVPSSALPGDHTVTATGESSGLSARATFTVRTDWTMFQFSLDRRGVNPYENVLGPSNVSSLKKAWATATSGAILTAPAVVDGVVYFGVYGDPLSSRRVYAADAATGVVLWKSPPVDLVSDPAVANGTVYVGSGDYRIYALDAATGAIKWSYPTNGGVFASPAVSNGMVYAGSGDGHLYALDAETGTLVWSAVGSVQSPRLMGTPASNDGTVFVASADGRTYAFDSKSGLRRWRSTAVGEFSLSSPAIYQGVLYIGSYGDDNVYAMNAANGHTLWNFPTGDHILSSPAIAKGVVYIGSHDDHLYALDAMNGALRWSVPTGGNVQASPIVANGVVYVGSADHTMYAIDARSGNVLWSRTTGDIIADGAAVADGTLYFGSLDRHMYAFRLPPSSG